MLKSKTDEDRFYVEIEVGDRMQEALWSAEYYARLAGRVKMYERLVRIPLLGYTVAILAYPERKAGWERIAIRLLGYFTAFVQLSCILLIVVFLGVLLVSLVKN
jgi:hypothetical protein